MSRLSIEITPEQHQRLKAVAALQGKSIKEYILERALPFSAETKDMPEGEVLRKLEDFLKPRIRSAEKGKTSHRTARRIFEDVRRGRR